MATWVGVGCATLALAGAGFAQGVGTVAGVVTDPSGATVADARVQLQRVQGTAFDAGGGEPAAVAVSGRTGRYAVSAKAGTYVLVVSAAGFAEMTTKPFALGEGQTVAMDARLRIEEQMQAVEVSDENVMDTDPNANGDQISLKGKDIGQLPLDSTELLQELQGLAGGNSPELYLNGFSGGKLPPRDTIREIRINQNPFSAQNDTNPVNGRIDVFTKPGAEQFHGDFDLEGNTAALNARNPFIQQQSPYYTDGVYAEVNGPITKHSDFEFGGNIYNSQTNTPVNAQVLDAGLNAVPFTATVAAPSTYTNFSTRVDFGLGAKSTVLVQYSLSRSAATNGGVGQLSLPEQGFDNGTTAQTFQASNSQIVSAKVVNDTRFQYVRSRVHQTPVSGAPAVVVQGSFNAGGSNAGLYHDNQDRYELQNYVAASLRSHYLNFGGRLRATRDANQSSANYNGQYTFADLGSYRATLAGTGGRPSQYAQTVGQPAVVVSVIDGALYLQDDWKVRKNVTISPGLRYETQTEISDHADFAPRLGASWSFGAPGKDKPALYVLRGGVGMFYKRFTSGSVLQAARQNGITQQQFVVNSPTFYAPGAALPASVLAGLGTLASSSVYRIGSRFQAPYLMAAQASLQRSLGRFGSVTATYLESRGVHDQLTRNVNAPLPGTYNGVAGVRPMGGTGNVYEYESGGVDRNHRLSVNTNLRFFDKVYLFGNYQFTFVRADTNGGFPSNQYNLAQDYGRANNDVRHQLNMGGNVELPAGFHCFAYLRATSAAPFNITVGQDLNGDAQFNDRPAFATDLTRASVVKTAYGNFDTLPAAGQTVIPINYGTGPGYVALNLNVGRRFSFGPVVKPPAGAPAAKLKPGEKAHVEHRYLLQFGVGSQNVFNHVNYTAPVGTLNSPLFGKFTGIANGNGASNRTVELETYFHF